MRTHTRQATFAHLPAFTLAQALLLALLGLASVRPALAASGAVVAWGWNTSDVTVSWNWSDDAEGDGGPIVLNGAWTQYADQATTFATGDVLSARAFSTGEVRIDKTGALIATITPKVADGAFFNAGGGKIGLWSAVARKACFDDLGGGTAAA